MKRDIKSISHIHNMQKKIVRSKFLYYLLHSLEKIAYLNEYGIITTDDQYSGSYDFSIDNGVITLEFTPNEDTTFDAREFQNTVLSLDINN